MSDEAISPPPDPLLRYRLRTVLWLTSALAVAAALAAPYFRRQSSEAQSNLLLFWASSLVFIVAAMIWRLRQESRVPNRAGQVYFWTTRYGFRRSSTRVRLWHTISVSAFAIFFAAYESHAVVRQADWTKELNWSVCLAAGAFVGLISSGLVIAIRAPVALCERGIPIYGEVVGWRQIRGATRDQERRGVLRLHSVDGARCDILIGVAPADCERVETFVREKIEGANAAEPKPRDNASRY